MRFTSKYLYVKFTKEVMLSSPSTGEIVYHTTKPTDSAVNTSVNMGEIRAGVSNPIVAIIPSDTNVTVDITAADFNLAMRAYQSGGNHGYGAPTLVCTDITATGTTLTIPTSGGTPVAGQGYNSVFAWVQTVGSGSTLISDGTPYAIDENGNVTGFAAVSGTTYKVWYFVDKATTEYATLTSQFDPAVLNCRIVQPVFANDTGNASNTDTQVGELITVIPYLKLGGNAGVTGSSSSNSTTSVSGTAIAYEDAVIKAGCSACSEASADLAYYLFVPCDDSGMIDGVVYIGGEVTMGQSSTFQLQPYLAVNGSLVNPDPAMLSYEVTTALTGLSVSETGLVTSGSTAGSGEITITYTDRSNIFTSVVNVTVE